MPTNSQVKVVMWSQANCQYCNMAKGILEAAGYTVDIRKVGLDEGNWPKSALLAAVPGARSVPQVFIDGKLIGGYKEVSEFLRND